MPRTPRAAATAARTTSRTGADALNMDSFMDSLVVAALAGTSKSGTRAPSETSVDALTASAGNWDELSPERQLLLRAGALAVYTQAGQLTHSLDTPTQPHPPETLPECPPPVAALMELLFVGEHQGLLPDALDRMRAAGWRLPSALLTQALGRTLAEERVKLLPVLGERGRWLARFNSRWTWAANALLEEELPANAETLWQEGTPAQRVEVLRRLRAVDPAKARAWVEEVWKQEKADLRAELLATFNVGLGLEDEPLLERALDDRGERARAAAASLLGRIPTSALATRMRARAEAMLTYAAGKLDAKPPSTFDKTWLRDGLSEKPPSGTGERAWWLMQVLRRVPPSHWAQRFAAAPAALLAATEGSKWRIPLVEGWTDAAERFAEEPWAAPLLGFWRAATEKEIKQARGSREGLCVQVVPFLSPAEREAWMLALIADPFAKNAPDLDEVLDILPKPWSDAVAAAYLAGLRAFSGSLTPKSSDGEPWEDTLDTAALALPPAFFTAALEPISLPEVPEGKRPNVPYLRDWLETFASTIRLRQRIAEEFAR